MTRTIDRQIFVCLITLSQLIADVMKHQEGVSTEDHKKRIELLDEHINRLKQLRQQLDDEQR